MNNDVLINFVLDRSGSMVSVTDATCEGFNQFKTDQKNQEGQAVMTLTLFDTTFETRFISESLAMVPNLGAPGNYYRPSGGTALFDAVGESIKNTEKWVKNHNWLGQVMVVTLTDGQENSSRKWHVRNPRTDGDDLDVAGLIDWKKKEGWDFLFLGAGGTDWLERTFQNLPMDTFFAYAGDSATTRSTYGAVSAAMTSSRATGQSLTSTMAEQKDLSEGRCGPNLGTRDNVGKDPKPESRCGPNLGTRD